MTTYIELFGLFVLLTLPFFYETSHSFRYYFKFLIYYGIVSFNSIVLIPVFFCRPKNVLNFLWASTWCRPVSTLIGLRWQLRGSQYLEKEMACVIVANHQSSLDVLGMFEIWPVMKKCTAVAKREIFFAWPFGLAAWLAGLIFIDRVRGEKARQTLNEVNSKIKKDNIKLWVFPEGTRRNTGDIHPFKKGAFHMAIDEQIPILPVVFSSYCTFLNDKKKILNSGNVIITTLPQISTVGLTKDDIPELIERVQSLMRETFKQTSAEILQRYQSSKLHADNSICVVQNSEDRDDTNSKDDVNSSQSSTSENVPSAPQSSSTTLLRSPSSEPMSHKIKCASPLKSH